MSNEITLSHVERLSTEALIRLLTRSEIPIEGKAFAFAELLRRNEKYTDEEQDEHGNR